VLFFQGAGGQRSPPQHSGPPLAENFGGIHLNVFNNFWLTDKTLEFLFFAKNVFFYNLFGLATSETLA